MKVCSRLLLLLSSISCASAVPFITLDFDVTVTNEQRQIMLDAAAFWNDAILGFDLLHDANGGISPHYLDIAVSIPSIDGPNGTLGSAGPVGLTYFDNNPLGAPSFALWYSTIGEMEFDADDVSGMIADQTFYGVVLHEMAHVLGIGTLWEINNNVNNTNYSLYNVSAGDYVGPNALDAWKTEFGQSAATSVPVEQGGGPGTAGGHWNEVDNGAGNTGIVSNITGMDFSQELMTGWASPSFFLSTVTLGALDDLGYVVDYTRAGQISYSPVPEPSVSLLCLIGGSLTICRRRRESTAKKAP